MSQSTDPSPVLSELLEHPSWPVRRWAAEKALRPRTEETAGLMLRALTDVDHGVSQVARLDWLASLARPEDVGPVFTALDELVSKGFAVDRHLGDLVRLGGVHGSDWAMGWLQGATHESDARLRALALLLLVAWSDEAEAVVAGVVDGFTPDSAWLVAAVAQVATERGLGLPMLCHVVAQWPESAGAAVADGWLALLRSEVPEAELGELNAGSYAQFLVDHLGCAHAPDEAVVTEVAGLVSPLREGTASAWARLGQLLGEATAGMLGPAPCLRSGRHARARLLRALVDVGSLRDGLLHGDLGALAALSAGELLLTPDLEAPLVAAGGPADAAWTDLVALLGQDRLPVPFEVEAAVLDRGPEALGQLAQLLDADATYAGRVHALELIGALAHRFPRSADHLAVQVHEICSEDEGRLLTDRHFLVLSLMGPAAAEDLAPKLGDAPPAAAVAALGWMGGQTAEALLMGRLDEVEEADSGVQRGLMALASEAAVQPLMKGLAGTPKAGDAAALEVLVSVGGVIGLPMEQQEGWRTALDTVQSDQFSKAGVLSSLLDQLEADGMDPRQLIAAMTPDQGAGEGSGGDAGSGPGGAGGPSRAERRAKKKGGLRERVRVRRKRGKKGGR